MKNVYWLLHNLGSVIASPPSDQLLIEMATALIVLLYVGRARLLLRCIERFPIYNQSLLFVIN